MDAPLIGHITSTQWSAFVVALEERLDISLPSTGIYPTQDINGTLQFILRRLAATGRSSSPLAVLGVLKQVLQVEFNADPMGVMPTVKICDLPRRGYARPPAGVGRREDCTPDTPSTLCEIPDSAFVRALKSNYARSSSPHPSAQSVQAARQ